MICILQAKNQFMSCLAGSGLNFLFQWKVHSAISFKLLLKSISEASVFLTTKKSEVPPVNKFGV